jgi:hypothetical protein
MLKTVPHNLEEFEALRGPNGVPTIPPQRRVQPNLVQSPREPSEDPMHA